MRQKFSDNPRCYAPDGWETVGSLWLRTIVETSVPWFLSNLKPHGQISNFYCEQITLSECDVQVYLLLVRVRGVQELRIIVKNTVKRTSTSLCIARKPWEADTFIEFVPSSVTSLYATHMGVTEKSVRRWLERKITLVYGLTAHKQQQGGQVDAAELRKLKEELEQKQRELIAIRSVLQDKTLTLARAHALRVGVINELEQFKDEDLLVFFRHMMKPHEVDTREMFSAYTVADAVDAIRTMNGTKAPTDDKIIEAVRLFADAVRFMYGRVAVKKPSGAKRGVRRAFDIE